MNSQKNISCWGHLKVSKVWPDGSKKVVSDNKNQLINGLLHTIPNLFVGDSQEQGYLSLHSIWLEEADDNDNYTNNSPTIETPQTTGAVLKKDLVSSNLTASKSSGLGIIEVDYTLSESEGNNLSNPLGAAALFTQGDDPDLSNWSSDASSSNSPSNNDSTTPTMLARQVFGEIEKQSEFSINFKWNIQFSIDQS